MLCKIIWLSIIGIGNRMSGHRHVFTQSQTLWDNCFEKVLNNAMMSGMFLVAASLLPNLHFSSSIHEQNITDLVVPTKVLRSNPFEGLISETKDDQIRFP